MLHDQMGRLIGVIPDYLLQVSDDEENWLNLAESETVTLLLTVVRPLSVINPYLFWRIVREPDLLILIQNDPLPETMKVNSDEHDVELSNYFT